MRRLLVVLVLAGLLAPVSSAAPSPELRIVFPEGMSARQMTDRVAAVRRIAIRKRHVRPLLTGKAYRAAVARARPPAGFGSTRSVEGFLFPSLYAFGPATPASALVRLQLDAFVREWAQVGALGARRPYDVLTVASMVEREAAVAPERPLVAAVIWNRLGRAMPLGIDATLRYGLGIQGTRPLTKAQLASDSPYNTRRFAGLPPTPIGNPGLASMRAAAHPAAVDYLYYLRRPGTIRHYFTADEADFCGKAAAWGYGGC